MHPSGEQTSDLVVVVPGITGSALEVDGRPVWAVSGRAIMDGVVSLGRSVDRLKLPEGFGNSLPTGPGEGEPDDGVRAVKLMPDLHVLPGVWSPVKGYSGLVERLKKHFAAGSGGSAPSPILEFPYDWRLSNATSARRLQAMVGPALEEWQKSAGNAEAKLVLVCHSMGGLVARWFLEVLGGSELTRWLITIGTPYQGSVKALEALVNGLPKGLGPFKRDLGDLVRTFPSMYELLPIYTCIEAGATGMKALSDAAVPDLNTKMLASAEQFHARIAEAVATRPERGYGTIAIKGILQPTMQSARRTPAATAALELLPSYAGEDKQGDGTVPRPSSHPPEWATETSGHVVAATQRHATLQETDGVFAQVYLVLTTGKKGAFMGGFPLGMELPDLLQAGEPVVVKANAEDPTLALRATVTTHDNAVPVVEPRTLANLGGGRYRVAFDGLPEGAYQVTVDSAVPARPVEPVSDVVVVWQAGRE